MIDQENQSLLLERRGDQELMRGSMLAFGELAKAGSKAYKSSQDGTLLSGWELIRIMAKFEIPRSSLEVTKGQATNITPLTMPYNIVQNLGSNINQAGQVFEQIKKDQRVLEDENRFYEIRSEISKNADAAVLQSSKMLSIDEAEANLFKAYEIDVSNESKGVQKLVNQYINLNRDKDRSVVYKAVMSK